MRLHTHRCEACGHTFQHDRGGGLMQRVFSAAFHMCPRCGKGPWLWVVGIVGKGGKVMEVEALARELYKRGHSPAQIDAAIERELNPE